MVGVEPFFTLIHLVPGFHQAHNTRLAIVTLLAIALLAGWGLDSLRPSKALRAIVAVIAVAPVVAGIARANALPLGEALQTAWLFKDPTDRAVLPLASILVWVPFALLAAVLIWKRPRYLPVAALALVTADLFRAGMGQNPAIPVAHAKPPVTDAMRAIGNERFVGVGRSELPPLTANVAMRYGLRDARGYDYPTDKRYDDLWRRAVTPPDPLGLTLSSTRASTQPEALRALGLLAVSRVLQPPDEETLPLPRLYAGRDAVVYENPDAVPRAFVVGRERVVDDQLAAVTAPDFDPRDTAVVSEPLGLRGGGEARLIADEPERVVDPRAGGRPRAARPRRHVVPGLEGEGGRPRRARSSARSTCCAAS